MSLVINVTIVLQQQLHTVATFTGMLITASVSGECTEIARRAVDVYYLKLVWN